VLQYLPEATVDAQRLASRLALSALAIEIPLDGVLAEALLNEVAA
jgi:hypothetical protein